MFAIPYKLDEHNIINLALVRRVELEELCMPKEGDWKVNKFKYNIIFHFSDNDYFLFHCNNSEEATKLLDSVEYHMKISNDA